MSTPLSFFNWSLEKAQDTEPEGLEKARIRIIFTVLLFSLLKVGVVLVMGSIGHQWMQVVRYQQRNKIEHDDYFKARGSKLVHL